MAAAHQGCHSARGIRPAEQGPCPNVGPQTTFHNIFRVKNRSSIKRKEVICRYTFGLNHSVKTDTRVVDVGKFLHSVTDVSRKTVLTAIALACLAIFVFLAALPTDLTTQTFLVITIYAWLLLTNQWRDTMFGKVVYFALITLLSLRYFIWRSFSTLVFEDPISFTLMILLYLAEVFGFLLFAFGLVVNIVPLSREKRQIKPDLENLPSVDIFVPTYNEAPELLSITVAAARQIDYPEDKLNVYVLDDGGTTAKVTQEDPQKRQEALDRQKLIQNLCKEFGAIYKTREENIQAKAGNINEALKTTDGDLMLVLDADHVPTSDILMRTVGYFQQRDDLFLVQTPHFMINADPIERNLDTFRRMPSENEMFYRSIQRGLDFWDASFFCGSAAILRRKALEETGGLCTDTITEDAETALTLHAKGWHSVYVPRPMVAGLAPETFSGLVVQRTRWAQGMVQILLLRNPLLMPNLTWAQRIGYLSSCLYWLFPIARFVFLIAPLAFLLFGLKIYNVSGTEFLVYTLPHFVGSMVYATFQFGKVRWPFIGAVYELMQSLYALPAVLSTVRNPHSPHFNVTPKGERLDKEFVSPLSAPFYVVFALNLIAFAAAAYRWEMYPGQHDVILVTGLWNFFNFVTLLMALGILIERRQLRLNPRTPADVRAVLKMGDARVEGRLLDLSMGGARFKADNYVDPGLIRLSHEGTLIVPARDEVREVTLEVRRNPNAPLDIDVKGLGLSFHASDATSFGEIVSLVHGNSERWEQYWNRNEHEPRVMDALMFLIRAGFINSFHHFVLLIRMGLGALGRRLSFKRLRKTGHAQKGHANA
ncbi:MAG: UDP-forming cellulose synthase catalytic subunit [Alphaproteobacteria bacterium]|nr:MAG: UDP-forming cellulose synthase catalytic subunit [Alphaproteobacteria bacterium]